jgi:hypothetical protein
MRLKLELTRSLTWLIAPLVTSSVFAASPSLAATFASSQAFFGFDNFSQSPDSTQTSTDTDTLVVSEAGSVVASAEADAVFLGNLPPDAFDAFNLASTFVSGEGSDYFGLAQSEARIVGNFTIDTDRAFSFDFALALGLQTSVDFPQSERAAATGLLSFLVLDSTEPDNPTVLERFAIFANLTTPGEADLLSEPQFSENVSFGLDNATTSFGQTQEFAFASGQGSFSRHFDRSTRLTLVEVKQNQAIVQTPEPTSTFSLLGFVGLAGVGAALKTRKVKIGSQKSD